jgi:hypothetical protein
METMSQFQNLSPQVGRLIDLVAKRIAAQLHAGVEDSKRRKKEVSDVADAAEIDLTEKTQHKR